MSKTILSKGYKSLMNVSCRVPMHKYSIYTNYNHPRKFLNCSNHRYYSNQSLMTEEHDTESIEDISNENSNNNKSMSFNDRRDYVFIENAIFHGYHGDLKEEKILGQKFECSVKLYPKCQRFLKVGNSDNLNDTLDYTIIINEIESIMKSKSYDMIEKLGNEIARNAFKVYGNDRLEAIQIEIRKPQVPITQMAKCVGVNIFRTSSDFSSN